MVLIGTLFGAYLTERLSNDASGYVKVSFVQTQDDADCILICQDNAAMMIDTGEEKDSDKVLSLLDEHGVTKLDYLILSHGDADHVGGVKAVTSHVAVGKVIAPYYQGDAVWDATVDYLEQNHIDIWYPTHNRSLRVGTMNMVVYPSLEKKYKNPNDNSLAVLVTHGEVNMLFTGDAMKKRSLELEMIHWPSVDLYKVPHHGRANSQTEELFEKVRPKYAVVTSDKCDKVIEDCAEKLGTRLLFTRNEPVKFISDGNQLIFVEKITIVTE